jgi:hypothetical protein
VDTLNAQGLSWLANQPGAFRASSSAPPAKEFITAPVSHLAGTSDTRSPTTTQLDSTTSKIGLGGAAIVAKETQGPKSTAAGPGGNFVNPRQRWLNYAGIATAIALMAATAVWFRGLGNSVDQSQRHITLRPVDASLSYLQAAEFMEEAARSGDWKDAQSRFLESEVRWTGYVVESKPPEFHVIRPQKESSGKKREEAIITLKDKTAHAVYAKDEFVRVSGWVHRFDSKGIDIVDATIEAAN